MVYLKKADLFIILVSCVNQITRQVPQIWYTKIERQSCKYCAAVSADKAQPNFRLNITKKQAIYG